MPSVNVPRMGQGALGHSKIRVSSRLPFPLHFDSVFGDDLFQKRDLNFPPVEGPRYCGIVNANPF